MACIVCLCGGITVLGALGNPSGVSQVNLTPRKVMWIECQELNSPVQCFAMSCPLPKDKGLF